MRELDDREPHGMRWRSFVLGTLLVLVGVLIGLGMAAKWEWTPFGHAVPEPAGPAPASLRPELRAVSGPGGRGHDFVEIVQAVIPAVVNILTTRSDRERGSVHEFFDDPFLRRFFGDEFLRRFEEPREAPPHSRGLGSGVIVDPQGVILTNHHVVGEADAIKVLLSDESEYPASLIGTDAKTDLAVLKIEGDRLPTIPWADSDRLRVGEYVLAVGHPFGLNQTVTMGIVSAVGRARMGIAEYEDFIQTDAAINPGNSGGPLVNARGELVGINTAIFSRSGGSMGIGFAVPSNMARAILDQLVRQGRVVRGWLGVSIQQLTPDLAGDAGTAHLKGVLVSDIVTNSPAEQAGLQRGDVIVEFDDKPVETAAQLKNVVAVTQVGKQVTVRLIRDGRAQDLLVVIGEQPRRVA